MSASTAAPGLGDRSLKGYTKAEFEDPQPDETDPIINVICLKVTPLGIGTQHSGTVFQEKEQGPRA